MDTNRSPVHDDRPVQISSQLEEQVSRPSQDNTRDPEHGNLTDQISSQLEEHDQSGSHTSQLDQEVPLRNNKSKKKNLTRTPPTIGVMFVDQTPGGLLAKRLQEVEDRLAKASGYRLRMVELSGTPLQRMLPNTNPWAGQPCGRAGCYTSAPKWVLI